jgi:transcription elongation factor S-II
VKKAEERAIKEQLHFAVTTASSGTRTNTFQCGKCRGKDTMYTQAQTRRSERVVGFFYMFFFACVVFSDKKIAQTNSRAGCCCFHSSDEPMTTFVLCNLCGNRWSFS